MTALPFSIDHELAGWELFCAHLEVERDGRSLRGGRPVECAEGCPRGRAGPAARVDRFGKGRLVTGAGLCCQARPTSGELELTYDER